MILNESIQTISIDENKLEKQMRKHRYDDDAFFEFIQDRYDLTDGHDYQLGSDGLTFTFYSHAPKSKIQRFRSELA